MAKGDTSYLDYKIVDRLRKVKDMLQIHRQTIDRQFPPNEAVDKSLDEVEFELTRLSSSVDERFKKETD